MVQRWKTSRSDFRLWLNAKTVGWSSKERELASPYLGFISMQNINLTYLFKGTLYKQTHVCIISGWKCFDSAFKNHSGGNCTALSHSHTHTLISLVLFRPCTSPLLPFLHYFSRPQLSLFFCIPPLLLPPSLSSLISFFIGSPVDLWLVTMLICSCCLEAKKKSGGAFHRRAPRLQ